MIHDERQRRVTLEQIELLFRALNEARKIPQPDVFVKAHIAALETDIARMRAEAKAYEEKARSWIRGLFPFAAAAAVAAIALLIILKNG